MARVTLGGIHGGSRLGRRTPEFGELPAYRAQLGNELLLGLLFVPHTDPTTAENIINPRELLW
jgi:hypothetical protein